MTEAISFPLPPSSSSPKLTAQGRFPNVVSLIGAPMKVLRTFLRKVIPWVVAGGVFAWLFKQYPPSNIYNALKYVNILPFCIVAISYFLLMFLIDTFSISRVLARFGHPERVRELMPARGATYLMMVINYAAAQAAFAFYQYRRHGIPISKMLGVFGIIVVMDLLILASLAFITTFFTTWPFEVAGTNIANFVRAFTLAAVGVLLALVIIANASANSAFVMRLRRFRLIDLIATTKPLDYLAILVARLPVHAFIMVGMYVSIMTFSAYIPFIKILSNVPLIFFIGALPITPGGIGASNAALVELLKPFVTGNAISSGSVSPGDLLFAFSLLWMFANYAMKALTGVVCMRLTSRDLFKPVEGTTEDEAEEEAAPVSGNI